MRTGQPVLPLNGHYKQILSSDFHSNGYQIATGSQDNTIRIWDMRMRASLTSIPAHVKLVSDVHFNKTDSSFLYSSSYDGSVKIFSCRDWTERYSLDCMGMRVSSVCMTSACDRIVVSTMEKKFYVYDRQQWTAKEGIINELDI